eukprot:TRINITY_DN4719_c0_g1_i2.p1 TRINITY_DN4719_c0_g1~~TRINITY_DN4719_c0_g1_i2.p1  ORF type:complete len:304 (-),score=29.65 TRINITY_DN4719_c0_g1_i2:76-987(-)
MPTALVNGVELHYEDTCPETDASMPVLVFLHGAFGNSMSWWQNIPVFQDHFRCIAFDNRGFGRSPDPSGEGLKHYINDLEAFIEHLKVDKVCLMAQSMGGRAALGYTCRKPERVIALVMASNWGGFSWPEQELRAKTIAPAETFEPTQIRGLSLRFQEKNRSLTYIFKQIGSAFSPGPKPALGGPTPGGPTLKEVRSLRVPVLVISGQVDSVFPASMLKEFAAQLPKSEYVEVAGAGHSVYYEMPDRFNEISMEFLQKHVPSLQDAVYVRPTARIVRALWDEPVVLKLTDKDKVWVPDSVSRP